MLRKRRCFAPFFASATNCAVMVVVFMAWFYWSNDTRQKIPGYSGILRHLMSDSVDWSSLKTGTPQSLGLPGSAGGTFTAARCGFVVVQTASAANATCYLDLNGSTIQKAQGGAASFTWVPMVAFVAKDDVIQARTSDNGGSAQIVPSGCFFVPIGS